MNILLAALLCGTTLTCHTSQYGNPIWAQVVQYTSEQLKAFGASRRQSWRGKELPDHCQYSFISKFLQAYFQVNQSRRRPVEYPQDQIQVLLDAGFPIDQTVQKRTALHDIMRDKVPSLSPSGQYRDNVIAGLLNHNADPGLQNQEGNSVIEVALQQREFLSQTTLLRFVRHPAFLLADYKTKDEYLAEFLKQVDYCSTESIEKVKLCLQAGARAHETGLVSPAANSSRAIKYLLKRSLNAQPFSVVLLTDAQIKPATDMECRKWVATHIPVPTICNIIHAYQGLSLDK